MYDFFVQDESVVKAYFGMIIEWSIEMKKEAEDTRNQ